MSRQATAPLVLGGVIYALFAASCFRLAVVHDYETGVSIGEGTFTLVGAAALLAAAQRPRGRALVVALGTLPLVGWFVATPWNSGPPFLVASIVVPAVALVAVLRRAVAGRHDSPLGLPPD